MLARQSSTLLLDAGARADSGIEAAAAIGSRIYWIAFHGSDRHGRLQPTRHRFLATAMQPGQPPELKPVGDPCDKLLRDRAAADALNPHVPAI